MAISATFEADFSSFNDAVQESTKQLTDFEAGARTVEDRLQSMSDKFSGQRIIQEATLMAKAIADAGGTATLTEKELARVGRTANEAAEKMRALGIEVPASLQQLADATAKTGEETQSLSISVFDMVKAYVSAEAIIGAVKAAWSGLVTMIQESIAAASEAEQAEAALLSALQAQGTAMPSVVAAYAGYNDQLQQTSVYSGDAITSAQALLATFGVMPRDMEQATLAAANLAAKFGKDLPDAARMLGAAAAGNTEQLEKLGVEMTDASGVALDFAQQVDNINAKFSGAAADAANTYAGRMQQLGNAWSDVQESIGRAIIQNESVRTMIEGLTRLITEQNTELNNNATANNLVSDAVILLAKGLTLAAQGFDYLYKYVQNARIQLDMLGIGLSNIIPGMTYFTDDMIKATADSARWNSSMTGLQTQLAALQKELEGTRGKTVALTASQNEDAAARAQATQNLKAQQDAAKKAADEHAAEVKKLNDAMQELDSVGESWQDTLAGMNAETVAGIASYLEAGAAQGTLATAYGVTASQVKAVTIMLKEQAAAQDLATRQAQIMNKLQLDLNRTILEGSKDVLQARLADIQAQAQAQIASLQIQQTGTEEMYATIQAIADQASANLIQTTLEGDDATRASYAARVEDARIAYEQATRYSDQFTHEEIARRADALNAAEADLANWTTIVNGQLETTRQSAGAAADSIATVNREFQSFTESLGGGSVQWDVAAGQEQMQGRPISAVAAGRTPGENLIGHVSMATMQAQRAWDMHIANTLTKIQDQGGLTLAETQKPRNDVRVESGAVQLQYPIMNDPQAKDELARLVGDAIMSRLTRSGVV
jgi:hypothetical protein